MYRDGNLAGLVRSCENYKEHTAKVDLFIKQLKNLRLCLEMDFRNVVLGDEREQLRDLLGDGDSEKGRLLRSVLPAKWLVALGNRR